MQTQPVIETLAPHSSMYLQRTRKFRQGFPEAKSTAFLMPETLPSTTRLTAKISPWHNTHFHFTFHLWRVVTLRAPSKVELQRLPGGLHLGCLAGEVDKTSDGISQEQWPGNPIRNSMQNSSKKQEDGWRGNLDFSKELSGDFWLNTFTLKCPMDQSCVGCLM